MPIYTIADPEGNSRVLENANYLMQRYGEIMMKDGLTDQEVSIVSLGDVSDKGAGEGVLYDYFEEAQAVNIAGNRDSNNIRTLVELLNKINATPSIRDNHPLFWSTHPDANVPRQTYLQFYREYLATQHEDKTYLDPLLYSEDLLCDNYDAESPLEKLWIHSEFVNQKTRGAPQRNMFRCQELGLTYRGSHTLKEEKQIVVDSLIADMLTEEEYANLLAAELVKTNPFPEGYKIGRTWNYLKKSVLLHLEKGTLFCHSGVFSDSYPYYQSGEIVSGCEDESDLSDSEKVTRWINSRNDEHVTLLGEARLTMIDNALNGKQTFFGIASEDIPVYDIALPGVAHALQSNDHNKKTPLTPEQASCFVKAGIKTIIFGHQPTCCATPLIKKDSPIHNIASDTALISGAKDNPQNRDGSASIIVVHDDGKTRSFGRLNDAMIRAFYGQSADLHDPNIGLFLGDVDDLHLGHMIPINLSNPEGHVERTYRITARLYHPDTHELGDYVLVCHETSGPFLSVPAEYGVVRIAPNDLENALIARAETVVFDVKTGSAQLEKREGPSLFASTITTSGFFSESFPSQVIGKRRLSSSIEPPPSPEGHPEIKK